MGTGPHGPEVLLKITDVRIRELQGVLDHAETLWEERLVMPMDVYPAHRRLDQELTHGIDDSRYEMRAAFLDIHTTHATAHLIASQPPGLGIVLDEDRIVSERDLSWRDA